jgi:NADH-quinone oxidoreductase subunit B
MKLQEKIAGEQAGLGGVSRPDPASLAAPLIRPPA